MPSFDYKEAFSRNLGLVSPEEQELLRQTTVSIAGMGAVGGEYITALARSGIGNFNIADFDVYELANFNRQYGATIANLGHSKTEVMSKITHQINPEVTITRFDKGVTPDTLNNFIGNSSILIDAIDIFEPDAHRLLIHGAVEQGIPVLAALPAGYGAGMVCFKKGGMGFDEYFMYSDDLSQEEKIVQLLLGFAPASYHLKYIDMKYVNLEERKGPSSIAACRLCAGLVVTNTLVALLQPSEFRAAPWFTHIDLRINKMRHSKLWMGNRNPIQKLKKYVALRKIQKAKI